MRQALERLAGVSRDELLARFPGSAIDPVRDDHWQGELIAAASTPAAAPVLLYLHGGAFILGSCGTHRLQALRLSYRLGLRVLLLDYRLAPEHPFPAAHDDVRAAHAWICRTLQPERLFLGGDSAGATLALALLVTRAWGPRRPDAAFAISPCVDLGEEVHPHWYTRFTDATIRPGILRLIRQHYCPAADLADPRLSPLRGELGDLPPLLLVAGSHEQLASHSSAFAGAARAAGSPVELWLAPGMQHVFPVLLPGLPESKAAMARIADLLARAGHQRP
jgi:acetyl esterase/lipase